MTGHLQGGQDQLVPG